MPKKFATENTKAVAARERKKTAKEIENERKEKAIEDARWKDDDKQVLKKQQKKVCNALALFILISNSHATACANFFLGSRGA